MANNNPPVKGVAFTFIASMEDMSNPGSYKSTPTIAAGDFQVSKDGGAYANMTDIPVVTPAASIDVQGVLTATEMNADRVKVKAIDQTSPKEWADWTLVIYTTAA